MVVLCFLTSSRFVIPDRKTTDPLLPHKSIPSSGAFKKMRKFFFLAVLAAVVFANYALIPSTSNASAKEQSISSSSVVPANGQKIYFKKHGIPNT